jgi:hypothetical protein
LNSTIAPAWSGGGSQITIQAGSLSLAGLLDPVSPGNMVQMSTNSNQSVTRTFNGTAINSDSLYISFLLKQVLIPSVGGGTVIGLDDDGSFSFGSGNAGSALHINVKQATASTYQIGVRKGQGSTSDRARACRSLHAALHPSRPFARIWTCAVGYLIGPARSPRPCATPAAARWSSEAGCVTRWPAIADSPMRQPVEGGASDPA